jgi:hypothetical protein
VLRSGSNYQGISNSFGSNIRQMGNNDDKEIIFKTKINLVIMEETWKVEELAEMAGIQLL